MTKRTDAGVPVPSDANLSLADIERRRFRPGRWTAFIALVLLTIVVPYGVGRSLALGHTPWLVHYMQIFSPQGLALIAWLATVMAFTGLGMMIIRPRVWIWRVMFIFGLAAEQFLAGACLLKLNFWYGTYVVFGKSSVLANAANLGIIAAGLGAAAFALLFVAILVLVRKDSRWNVLTQGWSAAVMFFLIELIALGIVLFGGLLITL